jgi:hypothetical protein
MHTAITSDGNTIKAGASAPREAYCPFCGAKMVLRRRRHMGKTKAKSTYFWRHQDNRNLYCPARVGPVR